MFSYTNVLSNEELDYLNNRPEVFAAKSSLDSKPSGMVYFTVPITNAIRDTLQSRFNLELPVDSLLPMRWIKGDIAPHVDVGSSKFENTYLVYLNDSPGEFIIDSQSYPIQTNTGFVFNEGLSHESKYTENVDRLLLGPMNELAQPVGSPYIAYYTTETAAIIGDSNNYLGSNYDDYIVGSFGGYTSWRIASNSTGTSSKSVVYVNGDTLIGDGPYYLYPSIPCFLEGSTILCQVDGVEKYVPVEQLNKGTLVKTSLDGYKKVVLHRPKRKMRQKHNYYLYIL